MKGENLLLLIARLLRHMRANKRHWLLHALRLHVCVFSNVLETGIASHANECAGALMKLFRFVLFT